MARGRAKSRPLRGRASRQGRKRSWWQRLPLNELLEVRIRDLGLRLEDSVLEGRVAQLEGELERADFRFRPHVWLSTDWFTPNGITGFAIPFYLAHPRLARLERQKMFEVEGGNAVWCMKLLRHETAHALDNAYDLHQRRSWRNVFGSPGEPYKDTYVPRPNSRRSVLNLDNWYAQSHPVEDFAETFAVWLRPGSAWRERYKGWPALRKLEYVDGLMREIRGKRPKRINRERMDPVAQLRLTLGEYYRRKQAHYGQTERPIYDRDLRRLFSDSPAHQRRLLASSFLRERRSALRRQVSAWTGQHAFVVDEVIREMTARCRTLRLRLGYSERETSEGAAVLITVHTVRLSRTRHAVYFR